MGIFSTRTGGAVQTAPILLRSQIFTGDATLTAEDSGSFITNQAAAGAVVLTLPAQQAGMWFIFGNVEQQDLTIAADTADTMAAFNDIAADNIGFVTANERVGGGLLLSYL